MQRATFRYRQISSSPLKTDKELTRLNEKFHLCCNITEAEKSEDSSSNEQHH